jgi:hypothetical protein
VGKRERKNREGKREGYRERSIEGEGQRTVKQQRIGIGQGIESVREVIRGMERGRKIERQRDRERETYI